MPDEIDEDERTNPVGLFNTARSYWQSAEHLNAAALKVTHPGAPVTFLFCHAIELYLKAYLRGAGRTVADLKKLSHRVAALAKAAVESGLKIEAEQSEILSHIDDADVAIEARYIVTGFKNLPTNLALSSVAGHLDQAVCAALAKRGFAVRAEKFGPHEPQQLDALEPDTVRVLVYLFGADDMDNRHVDAIAAAVRLQKSMVNYHLDCLTEANFADQTGSDGDGHTYWAINSAGRRHVVSRKLIQS